jgi:phosphoglycolate phosphatase
MTSKADQMPAEARAHFRGRAIGAVLFDLDGTLLDTAGDIALALNRAIAEFDWPPVSLADVRQFIGAGGAVLVDRAAAMQGRTPSPSLRSAMIQRFFHHYGELGERGEYKADPYPGAIDALRDLHAAGVRIAVVTNKLHRFSVNLLRQRGLMEWVDCVVGGDTCERRKPDPQPLLYACDTLGIRPQAALMVGDSINDAQAARAAGIAIICVSYGYNEGNDPKSLPYDLLIDSLGALPGMLLTSG